MARTVEIAAYPWATVFGILEIPEDIPDDEIESYVLDNWDNISFGEPELDYCNIDFEVTE